VSKDRDDFIEAYAAMRETSHRATDAILRGIEIARAERQNADLRQQVDAVSGQEMKQESEARRKLHDEINEWKDYEEQARGACVQIARLMGFSQEIQHHLIAGEYGAALREIREKQQRE